MTSESPLIHLSDDELVAHVATAASDERHAIARLVAALAEFDARKLYLRQGCSSLFTYCTTVLHLSEAATFNRTVAARLVARFPSVLARLQDGSLSLTAVRLLASALTEDNCAALLGRAAHQPTREIERLIAALRPQPDAPIRIQKLPQASERVAAAEPALLGLRTNDDKDDSPSANTGASAAPPRLSSAPARSLPQQRPQIAPVSADRYRIQFTASQSLHDKLRRAQNLMRHTVPSGDPAPIVERALDLLIANLEKRKFAAADRPRAARHTASNSRHIPASVKREVARRDQERCAFVGPAGRCQERGFLEFHHVWPAVDDGAPSVDNIQLRCRAHNQYEAMLLFAPEPTGQDGSARE